MVYGRQQKKVRPFHLALIAAPWHLFNRPSIQLGSLKAFLQGKAPWLRVNCHHPYLAVGREIGTATYQKIASSMWLSEALYAGALFPELQEKTHLLARREGKKAGLDDTFSPSATRLACTRVLENWLGSIDWSEYDLIGFSVCFHQLLASLFCARWIKKKFPETVIVFGGSSVLDRMQPALNQLASVDFCINGEGELPLLRLVRKLAATSGRDIAISEPSTGPRSLQLDHLGVPVPDYDDYFKEMLRFFPEASFIPVIPIEFSRGCWWDKCTFCNLNLQWRGYRQKTAEQMYEEVEALQRRHQCLDFTFTDNSLPRKEGRLFFEKMRQEGSDTTFFAELRVQHVDDFPLLRAGGLTEIQVGIEALSPTLLTKMQKGASVMENVFAMKRAVEVGLSLQGNLITEFPGSTEQERDETLRALDFVFPYAPLAAASFFLGHDSPICKEPSRFGLKGLAVHPKFKSLFPPDALNNLPLLVRDYRGDKGRQRLLWKPVVRKIALWRSYHENRRHPERSRPLLFYRDGGNFLITRQETTDGQVLHHRMSGSSRDIYLACRFPVGLDELCRLFPQLAPEKIKQFLADLCSKKLVFTSEGRYLSLAVHRENKPIPER